LVWRPDLFPTVIGLCFGGLRPCIAENTQSGSYLGSLNVNLRNAPRTTSRNGGTDIVPGIDNLGQEFTAYRNQPKAGVAQHIPSTAETIFTNAHLKRQTAVHGLCRMKPHMRRTKHATCFTFTCQSESESDWFQRIDLLMHSEYHFAMCGRRSENQLKHSNDSRRDHHTIFCDGYSS
jgi:hypothetical protein